MNGQPVGTVASKDDAYDAYRRARRAIASKSDELTLATSDLAIEGSNVLFGTVDSTQEVADNMTEVLKGSVKSTLNRAYSIKINEFFIS